MAAQLNKAVGVATKMASKLPEVLPKLPGMATGAVAQVSGAAAKVTKTATGMYRSKPVQQFLADASVELTPPPLAQFPAILTKGFRGMGAEFAKLPGMTVKEVGVKAIVVFEVGCWFLLGEIIGRRSFFGYKYELQ